MFTALFNLFVVLGAPLLAMFVAMIVMGEF